MRTRVKICGITRQVDAALATGSGADAIGFVLWKGSPRAISVESAARLETASPFVARVGVFVNQSPEEVAAAVQGARLSAVQLHGDEDPARYASVGAPVIKAVSLVDAGSVKAALSLPAAVTVLIDASDAVRRGGTGKTADWARARDVSRERPVILAGGISAANVRDAVEAVKPWAIDVSSGVESSPGIKSEERMKELFAALAAPEER
ncbi:MAG TPA: phosphoribosylanthranilate isomerase [Vicinamibacterales bacterium]|nr:phosphoribosylanthranilate isomerase [Vicinamibacterales bacterium]